MWDNCLLNRAHLLFNVPSSVRIPVYNKHPSNGAWQCHQIYLLSYAIIHSALYKMSEWWICCTQITWRNVRFDVCVELLEVHLSVEPRRSFKRGIRRWLDASREHIGWYHSQQTLMYSVLDVSFCDVMQLYIMCQAVVHSKQKSVFGWRFIFYVSDVCSVNWDLTYHC